jgi:hypothetical protein
MSFGYSVGDFIAVVQLAYKASPYNTIGNTRNGPKVATDIRTGLRRL